MGRISFNSLQSLRGIFAIFIFLHHLDLFEAGGDSGVSFFITLSGFVLSAGYTEKIANRQITRREFLTKRVKRLYSYHLIGFVMALLLMSPFYGARTPIIWLANLTMVQSLIPSSTFYFSCDAPSWCLSDLVFCYALFPLVIYAMHEYSRRRLGAFFTGALALYFIVINLLPESFWMPLIYINPIFRVFDFLLGMLLWQLFRSDFGQHFSSAMKKPGFLASSVLETILVAIYVGVFFLYPNISERYGLASYWWLPSLLIIICFAAWEGKGGIWSRLFGSRVMVWFGNLSFAFYMLHYPIIKGFGKLLSYFSDILSTVAPQALTTITVASIFITTLILSILTYYIVEPRLARILGRL